MSGGEVQQAAERYMRAGLAVIPVPAGDKNPNRPGWQTERHGVEDIPQLWNNGQGIGVLWGEPSGGRVDIDCDWPEAVIAARHIAPRTRTFGRPGAPVSHHVLRATDTPPKTKRYKVPGAGEDNSVVELLSTGTQSLVPPSMHSNGEQRRWYDEHPAAEVSGAECADIAADIATAALIARNWPGVGARHEYTLAAAGYIGRRLPRERAERVMEAAIAASGDEEAHKRQRDVADTLDNLAAGRPTTGGRILDDLAPGLVDQLQRWHGWGAVRQQEPSPNGTGHEGGGKAQPPTHDELRDRWIANYPNRAHGLGAWRRYERGVWPPVSETTVKAEIAGVIEAAKPEGIKPTASILNSTTELARVKAYVPDEEWDADPNVLVCANGALNLATRELMPHAKEHYATAGVPYAYTEGATCDVWEQRVMGELVAEHLGLEAVAFLQEFAGYALTTDMSHEVALWLTGKHGGGRSTILAGLEAMLGPRVGVLSLSDIERSSFALTNLPGKTLVTATEQPMVYLRGGGTLNAIISGEPLQVDRKYRDPITVVPRCKIAWAMNDLPRVGNMDDGIFRRVKIVELPEIDPDKRDPRIKEQVKASGAAILCWALDGLDRLRERGRFEVPSSIRSATEGFRAHNDVPALFIAEACERAEDASEAGGNLYEIYRQWCLRNGHKPLANNNAAREWRRLGFEAKRTPKGNRWLGLRVTDDAWQTYGKELA